MQLLFVNGRLLRSTLLTGAWSAGYATYAMSGRYPFGVLFVDRAARPRRSQRAPDQERRAIALSRRLSAMPRGARSRARWRGKRRTRLRDAFRSRPRSDETGAARERSTGPRRSPSRGMTEPIPQRASTPATCRPAKCAFSRSSTTRSCWRPTAGRSCSSISTPPTSASRTKRSRRGQRNGGVPARAAARALLDRT